MRAVEDVKLISKNKIDSDDVLELIQSFANTWFSLEAFDEDKLPQEGLNKSQIEIKAESLYLVVGRFKNFLKTPLALLGVDLKNFQFNKICHFANHPYLCKGL